MTPPLFTPAFIRLMLAQALQSLGYASVILLPRYLDAIGATRTEIGVLMASTAVGGLVTRPFVGSALDRLGRRPTIRAGTLALTLGMFGLGAITSVGAVALAAAAMVGVGTGTLFTAYFTMASDLVPPERRTEGLALFGIAGLLPLVISPLATSAGVGPLQIRWFLPAMGLVVLTSLIPLRGVAETSVHHVRRARLQLGRDLAARPLWSVWLANVVFSALVAAFMTFALVIAEHRGLDSPADVWLAYALAAVSVRVGGATLPDRIGPARLLGLALVSYIGAIGGLAVANDRSGLLIAGVLGGIGHGWCFPVLTAQLVNRTPDDMRGSAMAAFTGTWDLTKLLAPPLLGLVADAHGDLTMLHVAVSVALIGWLGWAVLEATNATTTPAAPASAAPAAVPADAHTT